MYDRQRMDLVRSLREEALVRAELIARVEAAHENSDARVMRALLALARLPRRSSRREEPAGVEHQAPRPQAP
jgi:hypothetical protein